MGQPLATSELVNDCITDCQRNNTKDATVKELLGDATVMEQLLGYETVNEQLLEEDTVKDQLLREATVKAQLVGIETARKRLLAKEKCKQQLLGKQIKNLPRSVLQERFKEDMLSNMVIDDKFQVYIYGNDINYETKSRFDKMFKDLYITAKRPEIPFIRCEMKINIEKSKPFN